MPHLSIEARCRIVSLYPCGYSIPSIVQQLEQENVKVSKRAVYWGTSFTSKVLLIILAMHVLATCGGTRDVYVPCHEKLWSTQTRNGNNYRFIIVSRMFMLVKNNEVIIERYRR